MSPPIRGAVAAACAAACLLIVAGCGGSSSNDNTSTGAAATGAATTPATTPTFTGQPIKIAVTAPLDTPVGSFPQTFAGAQAAARAINAKGGIKGREVQVVTCNGRGDPNGEVACGRKAVSGGAVAAVGSVVFANPGGYESTLQAGKLADVATLGIAPQQFSSPIAFPITYFGNQFLNCLNKGLNQEVGGDRVAAVSVQNPLNAYQLAALKGRAKQLGINIVGSPTAGANVTDFAPVVQQMSSLKPDLVILGMRPDQNPAFMTGALSRGATWSYCNGDGNFGPGQLVGLGQAAAKYYQGASLPPTTATGKYPQLKQFIADMKAQEESGDGSASISPKNYYSSMLNSWLGVQIVADVISKMDGPVTNETFLAALNKAKVDLGIVPPLDFANPTHVGTDTRVFNPTLLLEKWDADKQEFTLIDGGEVNLG